MYKSEKKFKEYIPRLLVQAKNQQYMLFGLHQNYFMRIQQSKTKWILFHMNVTFYVDYFTPYQYRLV